MPFSEMRRLLLSLRIEHSDRAPADCVYVFVCACVSFVLVCVSTTDCADSAPADCVPVLVYSFVCVLCVHL